MISIWFEANKSSNSATPQLGSFGQNIESLRRPVPLTLKSREGNLDPLLSSPQFHYWMA